MMQTDFSPFFKAFLDILCPASCLVCGIRQSSSEQFFCKTCSPRIHLIEEPFCVCCGQPFPNAAGGNHLCAVCLKSPWYFTAARAVFQYNEPIARLVHLFKYQGRTSGLSLFRTAGQISGALPEMADLDLILPVPLHPKRLRERSFNQALLLARTFFPHHKQKISPTQLVRTRWTLPQTALSGRARRKNVKGAFAVQDPRQLKGKRVLLVDDVLTTGATVNECARVLVRAGAEEVRVLTLARV